MNKRQDILDAAIGVFATSGYASAAMEHISTEAGVSKRTLYKYFPNKETLFDAIIKQLLDITHSPDTTDYNATDNIEEQLYKQCLASCQIYTHPDYLKLARIVLAESMVSKDQADRLLQGLEEYESDFNQWLRHAVDDGRFNIDDADMVTHHILSQIKSFCLWPQLLVWQAPPSQEETEKQLKVITQNFLQIYLKN